MLLCHDCALRSQTACRVCWSHVVGTELVVRTKNSQVTRVPMSPRLQALLNTVPHGALPLVALLQRANGRAHPVTLRREFQTLVKTVLPSLPSLRPHDLRRTMAELVYSTEGDLRLVQALLGHTNPATTVHYLERPLAAHRSRLSLAIQAVTNEPPHTSPKKKRRG